MYFSLLHLHTAHDFTYSSNILRWQVAIHDRAIIILMIYDILNYAIKMLNSIMMI